MVSRRGLLQMSLAASLAPREVFATTRSVWETAEDEDYWMRLRERFEVPKDFVMLNNGGVSPTVREVVAAQDRFTHEANHGPSRIMWRDQEPRVEAVREQIAKLFGADKEEIAIVRNATEGLQNILLGIDLKEGDEVLTTTFDYPRMITGLRQRERRSGVRLRQITVPATPSSSQELVEALRAGIGPRTKLILVSQVAFVNGMIFPVSEIAKLGVPTVVDGAHAVGQLPCSRDEHGADYFGCALHKWMLGPIGTGFMFIRRERIKEVWPLLPADPPLDADIRKFEQVGTHPAAIHNALAVALDLHEAIGQERKAARLQALRDRWVEPLREEKRFSFRTPLGEGQAQGLVTVAVGAIPAGDLAAWLLKEHGLYVTSIDVGEVKGIRVSPSYYNTMSEMDRLRDALLVAARKGIS